MGQNSGLLSSLTDWNSTLAGYADSISSGVVMPIALTVLALFMILELYNFTQTIAMNGGSTAFTIQQVALVMLKITLCRWAVLHSTEILNAMFEVAATVTNGIAGYVGSGQVNTEVDIENAISALPGGIGNMPVAMELMLPRVRLFPLHADLFQQSDPRRSQFAIAIVRAFVGILLAGHPLAQSYTVRGCIADGHVQAAVFFKIQFGCLVSRIPLEIEVALLPKNSNAFQPFGLFRLQHSVGIRLFLVSNPNSQTQPILCGVGHRHN